MAGRASKYFDFFPKNRAPGASKRSDRSENHGRAVCLLVLDRACKCARVHAVDQVPLLLRLCASSSKGRSVQFCVLNQYEPTCEHAYACEAALHDQDLSDRFRELHVHVSYK